MDQKTLRQLQMLGGDLCALWAEAASVVWLRSKKLAEGGPEAVAEAGLMLSEKISAHQELLFQIVGGKLGSNPLTVSAKATRFYLDGVRANRRRLSRG